ncbi:10073_t:CDS:10 [Diversispora eburnea]|uniref:10073_t:CDS:1 n=1 Tax=Diversispora eburnea TaxID=1213867 RepID=A0A9N8WB76_9GLOM|nr:10073_t:CDS:10 [Diversispora eburnea]
MFLQWISHLNLLEPNPAKFPLNVRKTLISEITQTLLQAHDPNLLSSTTHVKWVMEAIGQGFDLPLEEMTITANSKELYSQWLFEPNFRPAAIRDAIGKQEEQEFWQIIFHHYSLLFKPRVQNSNVSVTSTPTTPGFPSSANQTSPNFTSLQRHIELCKGVLIVLTMAGRTLGPQFSEDTWLVLLKVVLGITDCLLQKRHATTMADELCEHLLRVLFELWLRSRIRKVEMWDIFKKCFNQWSHRQQALLQWNATTLALTQRVVRLLYGPKEGADMVNISVGGYNVGLDLPTDFVYFAWHRMIYLINNPCSLPSTNFSFAILGIGRIIDSFQTIGQINHIQKSAQKDIESSLAIIPDGNTILHMFGTWLFQACTLKRNDIGYQLGRAEAFGILCRIFCLPQRREKFSRKYITQFYFALMEGLRTDSCLSIILMNTSNLFAIDLEGIRMMVPDFVVGIKMILPKLAPGFKTDLPIEELRLAAIKVASTIMCLPNHFEKVSLRENWNIGLHQNGEKVASNDPDEIVVNELIRVLYSEEDSRENKPSGNSTEPFTALKFYILELLLKSLKTEKSSYNLRYLLRLINVYVVEDVAFCPGLVGLVVKSIQEKVLTMNLPADVTLCAFDVLKDFNCARELVLAFSRFIDTMLSSNCGGLGNTYHLVEKAFDCMMRWILIGQWIIGDRDCHEAVISTISKGISVMPTTPNNEDENSQLNSPVDKKKTKKDPVPTKLFLPRGEFAVKVAAEIAMAQFINHLGNFPAWSDPIGPSRISTLFNDDLELAKVKIVESSKLNNGRISSLPELVRHFLIDGRIIVSFVEIPNNRNLINRQDSSNKNLDILNELNRTTTTTSDDGPSVIIVLRDCTGKYSWISQMCYKSQIDDNFKNNYRSLSPEMDREMYEIRLLSPKSSIPILRTETPPHFSHEQHSQQYNINNKDRNPQTIPQVVSFNDNQIPCMNSIFEEGSDSWKAYNAINKLTQRQKEAEEKVLMEKNRSKFGQKSYKAVPAVSNNNSESPQVFRLFMSQMGLLSLENRHRVIPLQISERLVKDLERLDSLNERDCLSASVYFVKSGMEEYESIINPPSISEDFEKFLNSLGWPVLLESHPGFKAKLNSKIYDLVCIIWIEDIVSMQSIPSKIGQSAFVYIFVHPLQSATGLYWIRIITPIVTYQASGKGRVSWCADTTKLAENPLAFGPLVDGMIVSRHTLGSLVRNTAISAHETCKNFTETQSKSFALRRQFIDEIYHRYKTSMSVSDFYTEIFLTL